MATPIADTVEVRLNWGLDGSEWAVNVLHYIVPGGFTVNQANADALAADIDDAFTNAASIQPLISDLVTLDSVGLRDIRVASQPEFLSDLGTFGTRTDEMLPRQTCMVLTLRTALAGRSYRGRVYLGGWTVGGLALDGSMGAAHRAAAEDFGDRMASFTVDSALLVLGVTSRTLELTTEVVSSEVRDDVWDWQRSRASVG